MRLVLKFFDMVDGRDPVGVFLLALVMLYLGATAGRHRGLANRWASYIAPFAAASYVLYATLAYGRMEPALILGIIWRALMSAAITFGATALSVAVLAALVELPVKMISRWIERRITKIRGRLKSRRWERNQELLDQAAAQRERELAPLRDVLRREAEAARLKQAQLQELCRNLRYQCQLDYNRLRPAVVEMFPQEEFMRLVDEALRGDTKAKLRQAVRELMDTVSAVVSDQVVNGVDSLLDVASDFDKRRATVENSSFSDQRKDDLVKYLNLQEEIEIRKVLER